MKKKELKSEDKDIKPKKSNKKFIITFIIAIGAFIILSYIIPFLFIFGAAFLFTGHIDYEEVNENIINVPKYNMTVEVTETKYDEEEKCFILYAKVDKENFDKKSKKTIFKGNHLEVTYKFKDEDGYVIGTEYLNVDEIDKNNKWKETVYFCGSYADTVKDFEVDSVSVY